MTPRITRSRFLPAALAVLTGFCGSLGAQPRTGHFAKVNKPLGEAETRGKGLFLQRCSICHLPQLPGRAQPPGPVLDNTFKDANPVKETVVRKVIMEGSPKMPGFQYTLTARDMDDVIAYLKALKDL